MVQTPPPPQPPASSNLPPDNHPIQYTYIKINTEGLSYCVPPRMAITSTAAIQRLFEFFFNYRNQDTAALWTNGPVNVALSSISTFLRYIQDEEIYKVSVELTTACVDFLQRWNGDPILSQQLLEVYGPSHPALYYYSTLFSINIGHYVTTADRKQGILVSYHVNVNSEAVGFLVEMQPNQECRTVIIPTSELSKYSRYLSFGVYH